MIKLKIFGDKDVPIPKSNDFEVYSYDGSGQWTPGQRMSNCGGHWCTPTGLYFSCFPVEHWMFSVYLLKDMYETQQGPYEGQCYQAQLPGPSGAILIDRQLYITYNGSPVFYVESCISTVQAFATKKHKPTTPIAIVRIVERPAPLELGFEKIKKKPSL